METNDVLVIVSIAGCPAEPNNRKLSDEMLSPPLSLTETRILKFDEVIDEYDELACTNRMQMINALLHKSWKNNLVCMDSLYYLDIQHRNENKAVLGVAVASANI
ncbi:MAG: hypothetical protein A3I06_13990 [Candidatus Lindowbacteria bacterium RIFCSPLOWO2_02_FULL_62_12]|nr:MAG: hypothetical protein A3I06_13990 [Candidatus Lindowbacteria bacterium RIFCSPLOWO2_02_FULL_62_12]